MENVNTVVLAGNLTRDPELRSLQSGRSVCSMRLAVNTRRKSAEGTWEDKANYFDVTVWGAQGDNCAKFLSKGSGCVVSGHLEWREWEQEGVKRQSVEVVADIVQFTSGSGGNGASRAEDGAASAPAAVQTAPAPLPEASDLGDIPFAWEGEVSYLDAKGHSSRW